MRGPPVSVGMGVTRGASNVKLMLYDKFGVDPDGPHPCIVMATPPLDGMPEFRVVTMIVLVREGEPI